MAYIDVNSEQHVTHGTHSHGEETTHDKQAHIPDPGPPQLKWSDLHPPGVKILPKGSPPAGPNEINWEDTLGGKFALAMEKLEGLLYAVFGSRPNGNPKRQWYDREHPRCLWGPETWERNLITWPMGCNQSGNCWDYRSTGKEYAALGEDPPSATLPHPTVPERTRSGDPAGQFAIGVHNREYFPLGCVSRDYADVPYDPEGSGWFGATQPGRQDGVGYNQVTGDIVTFTYVRPSGIPDPGTMRLYYQTKPPGGNWSAWGYVTMGGGPPTYTATRGPYSHGTEMRWYIRYRRFGVICYDPGGDAPPADVDSYYLQWFTHWNPYGYGLPEMLENYGDAGNIDIRHGTDFYQFDGSESVQYELINLVRWVLSWLGRDCCTSEYWSGTHQICAETDSRSDACHHNPRSRGGDADMCCIPMPIKFRWSGSNVYSHYKSGGKAGPLDPTPLHSGEGGGSPLARKSWRGINLLYSDVGPFANFSYGGGYSWGTAPGTFTLMYDGVVPAKVYAKYPSWGLRQDDVIEAVHIKEIIDAVDYLIDYGVWTTAPICSRKRTPVPSEYHGWKCGRWRRVITQSGQPPQVDDIVDYSLKCCETWGHNPDFCNAWPRPSWDDCTDPCLLERCTLYLDKYGDYRNKHSTPPTYEGYHSKEANCDAGFGSGCGTHENTCCYKLAAGPPPTFDEWACHRRIEGWSYWACTPDECNNGWDDNHGGLFKKDRVDHNWPQNTVATGPPGNEFSGNCLGDIYGCGDIYPPGGDDGLWFHEVGGVQYDGIGIGWLAGCTSAPSGIDCPWADPTALPPPIPGYGLYDANGDPLCVVQHRVDDPDPGQWVGCDGHVCECGISDFTVCQGDAAWVAVDLDLDGAGRPYRNFPGRNGDLPPYVGRGVPHLRDYSLLLDPVEWMHDCPCETWTNPGSC